jgi:hypothetical protein
MKITLKLATGAVALLMLATATASLGHKSASYHPFWSAIELDLETAHTQFRAHSEIVGANRCERAQQHLSICFWPSMDDTRKKKLFITFDEPIDLAIPSVPCRSIAEQIKVGAKHKLGTEQIDIATGEVDAKIRTTLVCTISSTMKK